jgi:hypothetical protein
MGAQIFPFGVGGRLAERSAAPRTLHRWDWIREEFYSPLRICPDLP